MLFSLTSNTSSTPRPPGGKSATDARTPTGSTSCAAAAVGGWPRPAHRVSPSVSSPFSRSAAPWSASGSAASSDHAGSLHTQNSATSVASVRILNFSLLTHLLHEDRACERNPVGFRCEYCVGQFAFSCRLCSCGMLLSDSMSSHLSCVQIVRD